MTLNNRHSLGDLNSCPYLLPTFELHCWRGHWAVWPSRCCWWYLWGRRGHRCKIDPWHQAASPDVCRESGSLNFNCNFSMPFPAHCPDLLAGYTWLYDYKWKISVAVAFFVHVLCSSWVAKARTFQGPYDSHIAAAPSNEGSSRKAWIVWSPRFKDGGSSKCAAKPGHFNMSYHNQQPTAANSKLHTGVAILVIILSYHI